MARKMKDSGIEWIGEIPEGWEISKVSYFYEIQLGKMLQPQKKSETDTEEMYLCAANVGKNSLSLDTLKTMWFSQTEKHQFDLKEGDLLVVEGGDVASCAIIETPVQNIFFQNALHRVRPLHNESVAFLRYWLMTAKSYGYIDLICNKATIAHFSKEKFIALPISVIPQDIQSKIVSFLDLECKQIDDLLSKTRSSIEEYKKLKQAVITQAVTKTIYDDFGNPSKFRKLRSLCDVLSKGTTPKDIETQNDEFYCIRYLKSENIVSNQLNLNPTFFITAETNNSLERSKLNSGDILFVIAGASIGKVAITTTDFLPANTNQAVAFIRLSSSYQYATKYIWYFLQSDVVKQLIALSAVQSAQPNLSLEDLGAMRLPLPDQMGCLKITDYLDAKCAEIDRLIAKKEQLVKELESYKKSLIYEVVTGKREV